MNSKNNTIDFENSIGPWLGKTVKILDYFLQESLNKVDLNLTKEQMIILKKTPRSRWFKSKRPSFFNIA